MGKVIKVSDEVAKKLDSLRHTGQSYDGVLRELLDKKRKGSIDSHDHKNSN